MVGNQSEPRHTTRDEQIDYLESQIQAYKARTSLLQQQQISTLDTLDEVLHQHKQEIEEETTASKLLKQRLRKNKDVLKEIERERDDLRDVVLELIAKVETSQNDFRSWPYSKLQLSSHTDPAIGTDYKQTPSILPSQAQEMQENLTYAGGIVRALKHELFLERQAHAQTRARVHALKAQVASRDAALEAWAQRTGTSTPVSVKSQNKNGKAKVSRKGKGPEARDLDRAEISSLFIQTVSNNRMLEQEIRNLFSNLEKARLRAEALPSLQIPLPPSSSPPPMLPKGPSKAASTFLPSSPDRGRPRERRVTHHIPHEHRSHTRSSSPHQELIPTHFNPQPIAGPSNPPTRRRTSSPPRRRSHTPAPTTSHTHDHHTKPSQHASRSQSRHLPYTRPPPVTVIPSPNNVLHHLDDQIHLLSAQIDAFRAERAALLRVIDSQLRGRREASPASRSNERNSPLDPKYFPLDDTDVPRHREDVAFEREHGSLDGDEISRDQEYIPYDQKHGYSESEAEPEHEDLNRQSNEPFGVGDDDEGTEGGERSMDLATPSFPVLMVLPVVDAQSPQGQPPLSPPMPTYASGPSRSRSRNRVPSDDSAGASAPGDGEAAGEVEQLVDARLEGADDLDENEIRMIRPRMDAEGPPSAP
ncbi:hypothetical protein FPV67DRAFT_1474099 [Lyophyllum atratum]|nr:hypothetical protein FPV67DRAFT_1474099 [Lyophyllum atratum]